MKLRFFFSVWMMVLISVEANADPVITSFTPTFGATNDAVTISGSGFGSGYSGGTLIVKFNGVRDTSAYANTADGMQILAHVPVGAPAGSGPIAISVSNSPYSYSPTDFMVIPPGPYVTGFSPASGGSSGGTSVNISGVHFLNPTANRVKFNGVNAASIFVNGDTLITATTPSGITTGPITVGSSAGTNTTSTNFFVPPSISSFAPINGRAGTNVTISGVNFLGATRVTFNGTDGSFTVQNNTSIQATVPNTATSGTLWVYAPAGATPSATSFTVLPTVSGFSPTFGSVGTSITVTGANFTGATSVKLGAFSASFSSVTSTSLLATVPSNATNAPVAVTVGSNSGTSAQIFYVTPSITSFTPTNSAPGTTVKITGNNFSGGTPGTGATAVSFGGVPATSFYVSNNTTIGAIVPSGVITGPISVTTPAGTVYSSGNFYALPVVLSFNPAHGADNARITITGTNFLGATAVLFNGTSASFTVTNNGVIGATVPSGATSGPITVFAPGGTNSSASSFTVDLTSDLNVGVVDSPDPVFVTSNLTYTITVANNGPDAALNVKLTNTLPASVILKSASSVQFTLNTNANPILGTLASLNNGAVATVTLNVVPQTAGWITNVAMIGSDNIDPSLADHAATNATLVWPSAILSIQTLTSNQVKVFWPAPLSNFYLLSKTNLIPSTIWSTDLTSRVLTDTNISVTETNSGAVKFFRLKQ